MSRKTFSVEKFKSRVNAFCLNSPDDQAGNRKGMMTAIEMVLLDTGNYRGFGYLTENHMKDSISGKSVGINMERPSASMTHEEKFSGTDPTRVVYF